MVKNDNYYISKLIENIKFIYSHMSNQTQETLERDEVLLDSMMFRLVQISENAKNLSEEFKIEHNNIPWMAIYGLRNRIVHDYGNIDLGIIFNTLKYDIAEIKLLIEKIKKEWGW